MSEGMYPLTFKPRLIEKIWGGSKLQTVLGKALPPGKLIGESWEIFDFPPGVAGSAGENGREWVSAEVVNGPLAGKTLHELLVKDARAILGGAKLLVAGKEAGTAGQFPLLVKYLDAREDLSVQVHPTAAYAAAHPGAHLKTESWYIVQHDPASRLLKGLVDGVTPDVLVASMTEGTVEKTIAMHYVKDGQCYFLPSGTVHALGAGILAAEVQTPSDTTFRLYDFNRIEAATGKPRKLHLEESLACIDFEKPDAPAPQPAPVSHALGHAERLNACEFYTLDRVTLAAGTDAMRAGGTMAVWMVTSGQCEMAWSGGQLSCGPGQTVLWPAAVGDVSVTSAGGCSLLEARIPA